MVKGTENLQWVSEDLCSGYPATWDVQESGVGLTPDIWGKISGAIFAFDPPYGRNAWKSDDGYQLFLKAVRLLEPLTIPALYALFFNRPCDFER